MDGRRRSDSRLLLTIFIGGKRMTCEHDRIVGYSGRGHIRMESVKVADRGKSL